MDDLRPGTRIEDVSWRPIIRVLVGVALLIAVLLVVRELGGLLKTLLVAMFAAIAIDAAARFVQRVGMSRPKALVTVILGAIIGGLLVTLLLVQPLFDQAAQLADEAPAIVAEVEQSETWQHLTDDLGLGDDIATAIKDVAVEIPAAILDLLKDAIGGIFGLVNVLIATCFMLVGGGAALALLLRLVPPLQTANGWAVVVGAYNNIGRYIIGATVQAVCAGTALTLVLLVLGVPYAFALGVFMLIMDYIPLVGATLGSIPAVAVALFTGGWFDAIMVTIFLIVYQQVENTIIQPRIQGKVVKLPGIAIFFSVMVGGELLGVLGALIAVPVASIVAILMRQYFDVVGRPPVTLPRMFDDEGRPLEIDGLTVTPATEPADGTP